MSKIAHILALQADRVLYHIGGPNSGLVPLSWDALGECPLLQNSSDAAWIGPRPILEKDPTFVQPIPYIVVTADDKVLTYVRHTTGGEGRLHNKVSIGFGGHIDLPDVDYDPDDHTIDIQTTLAIAAHRELQEELAMPDWLLERWIKLEWTHAIHSAATEVDQVHLGLVCEAQLTDTNWRPDPAQLEDTARELRWLTWEELAALTDPTSADYAEPETWTRLLIEERKGA